MGLWGWSSLVVAFLRLSSVHVKLAMMSIGAEILVMRRITNYLGGTLPYLGK